MAIASQRQLRGFNPSLFVMDDGREVDTSDLNDVQKQQLGQQAFDAYQTKRREQFLANQTENIRRGGSPAAPAQIACASPAGSTWDGYSGYKRGLMLGNEKQGRSTRVIQNAPKKEDTMPTAGYGSRPSIQALSTHGAGAADWWEPEEVRTAKLRILQAQGDRMAADNIETDRQRDPMMRRYDQQQDNEAAVTREHEATGPIFNATRNRERDANMRDIGARAYEERTNPFIREARDEARGDLTTRASMDAFGRAMAGMRPETVEQVENNPSIVDTIRNRMMGRVPAAPPPGGGVPAIVDEEPTAPAAFPDAPQASMPRVSDAGQMAPVVRLDLEQKLREAGYVVNDQNLLKVYDYLRTQQQ